MSAYNRRTWLTWIGDKKRDLIRIAPRIKPAGRNQVKLPEQILTLDTVHRPAAYTVTVDPECIDTEEPPKNPLDLVYLLVGGIAPSLTFSWSMLTQVQMSVPYPPKGRNSFVPSRFITEEGTKEQLSASNDQSTLKELDYQALYIQGTPISHCINDLIVFAKIGQPFQAIYDSPALDLALRRAYGNQNFPILTLEACNILRLIPPGETVQTFIKDHGIEPPANWVCKFAALNEWERQGLLA